MKPIYNKMNPENRISIVSIIILLLVCSVGSIRSEANSNSSKTTTIILIRHAERDNFFILTGDGHKRAKALVDAVGDMGIEAIYSPDLERNLDTVKPLASHLRLDVTLTPRIQGAVIDQIVKDILLPGTPARSYYWSVTGPAICARFITGSAAQEKALTSMENYLYIISPIRGWLKSSSHDIDFTLDSL
ncbi:MAG: histidine phosphatase family protein [bacterium]|nr:histidine phosphatase family protein [bacterium]